MEWITGFYPRPKVDTAKITAVGQAGGVLLTGTVRAAGLDVRLSHALARWRKPMAVHDPGKVITDLALSLALGGGCLADVAVLRAEPAVFGRVASDPTISQTITALARDAAPRLRPTGPGPAMGSGQREGRSSSAHEANHGLRG